MGIDDDLARLDQLLRNPGDEAGVESARLRFLLGTLLARYSRGDEATRGAVRDLFARHRSFPWPAAMPGAPDTPTALRLRLLLVSARDPGGAGAGELAELCRAAAEAGVDPTPMLAEVAEVSSDLDQGGTGSTRALLQRAAVRPPAPGAPTGAA